MAKDVVTFLNWAAEPEHDERKKMGIKAVILFSALFAVSIGVKRFKWTVIKNRKICKFLTLSMLLANFDREFAVYNPPKDLNH
jgi:ubiquinol-cytochrome c reductase cytochrome c1 subunit